MGQVAPVAFVVEHSFLRVNRFDLLRAAGRFGLYSVRLSVHYLQLLQHGTLH